MDGIESIYSFANFTNTLERELRSNLARLNNEAALDPGGGGKLVGHFNSLINKSTLRSVSVDQQLSREQARHAIKLLSFVGASVDTHMRRNGHAPGDGFKAFEGLVEALLLLAERGAHPPTQSHWTYWLDNDSPTPLTFTGGALETHFNRAVCGTDRIMRAICTALNPIIDGAILLSDSTAFERVATAARCFGEVLGLYAGYNRAEPAAHKREFVTGMRPFLAATEIGGGKYFGPNAAYIVSCLEVDIRLGFDTPWYRNVIAERLDNMLPEEREHMLGVFAADSLVDVVFSTLGVDRALGEELTPLELATLVLRLPPAARRTIKALEPLYVRALSVSATHYGKIVQHITKAQEHLTLADQRLAEVNSAVGVSSATGVSGKPIEDGVKRINEMRLNHPAVERMKALARAIPAVD